MSKKIEAGGAMPDIEVTKLGGGTLRLGGTGRWQMTMVYRGQHCPLCKKYLGALAGLKDRIADLGLEVVAVSADNEAQARGFAEEVGLDIPVGFDLTKAQMQELGLYVSTPRPKETDHDFPEPGLFVTNPDGKVQIVDISNAPFARPDIAAILNGIAFIRDRNYPIRGTAA